MLQKNHYTKNHCKYNVPLLNVLHMEKWSHPRLFFILRKFPNFHQNHFILYIAATSISLLLILSILTLNIFKLAESQG